MIRCFNSVVDYTQAQVISQRNNTILRSICSSFACSDISLRRVGASVISRRWLARQIVGDCVRIYCFPLSLCAQITSLDFLYRFVFWSLISCTTRELNIRLPLCFFRSYTLNSKTLFTIKPLNSLALDNSKGSLGVLIIPFCRRSRQRAQLDFSFAVIKAS